MIAMALLVAASFGPQADDPLAPARQGKIQCVTPDRARKRCQAIIAYTFLPDGTFEAVLTSAINSDPPLIMEIRSAGTVESGAICSVMHTQTYQRATFTMNGKPLDAKNTAAARNHMADGIAPLEGVKACSHPTPDGDMYAVVVSLDGKPVTGGSPSHVLWISPSEGYTVSN